MARGGYGSWTCSILRGVWRETFARPPNGSSQPNHPSLKKGVGLGRPVGIKIYVTVSPNPPQPVWIRVKNNSSTHPIHPLFLLDQVGSRSILKPILFQPLLWQRLQVCWQCSFHVYGHLVLQITMSQRLALCNNIKKLETQ